MKLKFCVLGAEVAVIAILGINLLERKAPEERPTAGARAFVLGSGMSGADRLKFESAGPSALRGLLPALTKRDTGLQRGYAWFVSILPEKLSQLLPAPSDSGAVRANAAVLVGLFGPQAKSAVPSLANLLQDDTASANAAISLGAIGPEAAPAVPALMVAVKERRPFAALALGRIGSAAKVARALLAQTAQDGPLWQRHECQVALRQINAESRG